MTEILNYSITIHVAKNRSLLSKWSLLKLFFFTALQVNHTHDENNSSIVSRIVENIGNADRILMV